MRLLLVLALLPGCGFGLDLLVDSDGPRGGRGGPDDTGLDADADTDADSDTDTDADSDADTDTDTDADTDSDTDADTDADTIRVDSVSPEYSTTVGGTSVTIRGGPFDSTATVRFGSATATRVSVSSAEIVVTAPAQSAEGEVDVKVETSSGAGTLASGFTYYEDGAGKAGLIGGMNWYDTVGEYWAEEPRDVGTAWFFLSPPVDFEFWELWAPTLDSCRSEYTYSGSLSFYEPGIDEAVLRTPSGGSLPLPWDGTQQAFYLAPLTSRDFVQGGTYDLDPIEPDGFPRFDVPDVLTLPSAFSVTTPNMTGSSVPTVRQASFTVSWSGTAGDVALISLGLRNAAADAWVEEVTCAVRDDGSFTVPSGTWTRWASGRYVDISVGRARMPTGTLPFNHADSAFAGVYWVQGLGQTQ